MRRLWAQIAALGVGRIILTNAERVERDYFDAHVLTPDGYRPLLIEGLQQARDTRLPMVSIHKRFKVLVEDELDALVRERSSSRRGSGRVETNRRSDVCPTGANASCSRSAPKAAGTRSSSSSSSAHGFEPVGMGPRTLRTDTACVALLALAHASFR